MKKSKEINTVKGIKKPLGLYDHIKHIQRVQDPEYYNNLSESDRKSFNKYMILRSLSMNSEIVNEMAYVSKYFEQIPEPQFYKVLIGIVPKEYTFYPYIKNSSKLVNPTILECVAKRFKIGYKDANDYLGILTTSDDSIQTLIDIIRLYGYSDQEIEKMFE